MESVPYEGSASILARPVISALLDSRKGLTSDRFTVLEEYHPWIIFDAYLFNAIKYLWQLEEKGDRKDNLEKALFYLNRWQGCSAISKEDRPEITKSVAKALILAKGLSIALAKSN